MEINHCKTTNYDEFEFGTLTPSSPSQDSFTQNSPADHFFFNGRLLPHSFPPMSNMYSKRSVSLTTSEYNSRSNSTSSRSSICSSASYSPRTSSSSDNKLLDLKPPFSRCDKTLKTTDKRGRVKEMVGTCLYRSYSSQRWQHITPAPVKMSGGIRVGGRRKKAARMKKKKTEERRGSSRVMKWWRRVLMAAVFACRECHALEGA